jgi:hypothetical protein
MFCLNNKTYIKKTKIKKDKKEGKTKKFIELMIRVH